MSRNLTIVFGNESSVEQEYAISGTAIQTCEPGDAVYFDETVTGDASFPFTCDAGGDQLATTLQYTYSSDSYAFFPDYTQYLSVTGYSQSGCEVFCSYAGDITSK